jgi:2-keto-4-pentenoate hydratase/2-oxohepta-3-ene-1,7-dioic acid hydratase in catechol pathway
VAGAELARLRELPGSLCAEGRTHELGAFGELGTTIEEAIAAASRLVHLDAGDVVALGPWPRGSTEALGVRLGMHSEVEASIRGLGRLRGVAVQRTCGGR